MNRLPGLLALPLLLATSACTGNTQGGEGSVAFSGPAGIDELRAPWSALERGEDAVFGWMHTAAPDDSDGATLLRAAGAAYVMSASGDFDDADGSGWFVQVTIEPFDGPGSYEDTDIAVSFSWVGEEESREDLEDGYYQPEIGIGATGGCMATIEEDTLLGRVSCSETTLLLDETPIGEPYEVSVSWEAGSTPFR